MELLHHHLHNVVPQWGQSLDVSWARWGQQGSQLREEAAIFYHVGLEQHRHHGGQVFIRQLENRGSFVSARTRYAKTNDWKD